MSSVLIIGGDHVEGIKAAFLHRGINETNHWDGRKVGDSHKVIPQNTRIIVLVTKFISHALMYKIKSSATKRGLIVLYIGNNGTTQLKMQLEKLGKTVVDYCRKTYYMLKKIPDSI